MVDGDNRNDVENMKNMEHQGEDENYVLTTMENNPTKKAKKEKIKRMLIEVMAIQKVLAKKNFESNLNKKATMFSHIHLIMGQNVMNDS